jgi:threonyl-tRNA synthetase
MKNKKFVVLQSDGKLFKPDGYKAQDPNFDLLIRQEALGERAVKKEKLPEYVKVAHKLGFEKELMSDKGHMRYNPKGDLILRLVKAYSRDIVRSIHGLQVYEVSGSNMFDLAQKAISEHAELFGDRLYKIKSDKSEFVLRYAACFAQFAMAGDWQISHKQLPFGMFEIADSYRAEQSGECMLLFRDRRFHMPDLHILARDYAEAKVWVKNIQDKIFDEIEKIGRDDYDLLINVSSEKYFNENKEWFCDLLKREHKKAGLICIYPEGVNYYWVLNIEYHIIDALKHVREIGTVQIDFGNAKRFGIQYVDEKGKRCFPLILHQAIIGAIERYIYAIIDKAVIDEQDGKIPAIPYWLCPSQVRLIPVGKAHLKYCEKLADKLEKRCIRVDIDEAGESVSKRVRKAFNEWIPFCLIIGDKEVRGGKLPLRDRKRNSDHNYSFLELAKKLRGEQAEYPWDKLPYPRRVSERVKF